MPQLALWRIEIVVPSFAVDTIATALEDLTDTVSWFLCDPHDDESDPAIPWRVAGYTRTPPGRAILTARLALAAAALGIAAPDPVIAPVAEDDWLGANLRSFQPVTAARFFIHGSHYRDRIPAGRIGLMIDAGMAFGSGEHASTLGCLLTLDRLLRHRKFARPLDLGCGTGILAIALAKASRRAVAAFDIEAVAARVAADNARRNGVASLVRCGQSNGYRARALRRGGPYDLVMANILARPLCRMATDLGRHLAPGGRVVLSGLLAWQERAVLAAHRLQGLHLAGRLSIDGWTTLLLTR